MHGLYVMWWVHEKHVPVAAVAAILAAGDLALTALEIPTGWLADRYGHRASLIAGSLLQIAGMLFAWLGAGVPGVLVSSLIIACGDAFRSGADQALLYRSCVALSRESEFQRIEARTRSLQLVALVVLVLAGGAIVEVWGFAAGWIVETAVSIVGLGIACAFVEPPAANGVVPPDVEESPAVESDRIRGDLRSIVMTIAPAAFLVSIASAATFLTQAGDIEPAGMTALVAAITLAEACGAAVAARVRATIRLPFILAATGAALAIAALIVPAVQLPSAIILCFLMGLALPVRAAVIQRHAADDVRARAASLASACDKALATIGLIVAGVMPSSVRRR